MLYPTYMLCPIFRKQQVSARELPRVRPQRLDPTLSQIRVLLSGKRNCPEITEAGYLANGYQISRMSCRPTKAENWI